MLLTRILTAAVVLFLLVGFAWLAPPLGFDVLLLVILSVACYEWLRLLNSPRWTCVVIAVLFIVLGVLGLLTNPAIILAASGSGIAVMPLYVLATLVWILLVPFAIARRTGIGGQRLAGQCMAIALCVATWLALLQADGMGKGFLLSVLLIVWVADTAAYFAGRAFGRHKLAPAVSPGKTWEGVIGALLGNVVLALGLISWQAALADNPGGSVFALLYHSLGLALMLACIVMITLISVMGDLYESLLKRIAGVKDSGVILPGHGGVFDRIDALMAVFPVTMCLVTLMQSGQIGR
jgi:phosphatidate cytidylyltransferase